MYSVSKISHCRLLVITTVFALSATTAMSSDAVLLQTDSTTQGAWTTAYGSNGYMIANGPSANPSNVTASVTGAFNYTWANLTSDGRALQTLPLGPNRMAASYTQYQSRSFNVNVSTLSGVYETVALYFLDWDTTTRAQKITISDASTNTVIGSPYSISSFRDGVYMVFKMTGNLVITVAPADGLYGPQSISPVLSGVFFGPGGPGGTTTTTVTSTAQAVLLQTDSVTQGAWPNAYGSTGYLIANGPSVNPANATASVNGAFNYTWANLTNDPRALPTSPLAPDRMVAAYTQSQSNNFNVNITTLSGVSEVVALYFVDWDTTTRAQKITIRDASTNVMIGAPQTLSGFHNGVYLVFKVTGNLVINIAPIDTPWGPASISPVLSGIFFGQGGPKLVGGNNSTSSAVYKGTDTTTQGAWGSVYGGRGYMIANGASIAPTYATANVVGDFTYTWAGLTSDVRALQTIPGSTDRMASTYTQYQSKSFSINININDGGTHRVALYMLDWDTNSRVQTITIRDLSTNTVLDVRTFSGFHDGMYASWDIKGNVVMTIAPIDYAIPVVSGIFFN